MDEERGTDHGQTRQTGQRNLDEPRNRPADVGRAHERAQPHAAEHQRQAGGQLVGTPVDDEPGEERVEGGAGESGRQHAGRRAAGVDGRHEAGDGADQHHALQAEVHDARSLADHLGQRGVEQRRAGHHRAGQEALHERRDHARPPARPSTTKSSTAIRMLATEPGKACVICKMSPPAVMTASTNAAATMPSGCPPAIQATRNPV